MSSAPTVNQPIRVLLVDDQALFREGLSTLLSVHDDLRVVGEASDGQEALARVAELEPKVVLMDLRMPNLGGVEATRRIRASHPEVRIIILTTFDDDEDVFEALRLGAAGYLLKDSSSARLVEAIHAAVRGESFLQPSIAAKVVAELARLEPRPRRPAELPEPLSERELSILQLLARGATNKEIAASLYLAEGTVKNYMTAILGKLGASDRTQAALEAKKLGLI
ncbi:MAG: response regulator transcription factor [Acidobacteriota bacterium]